MTRHNKKSFSFFLWHRRLGLFALLLLIILSITGIMLNHTEALELDSRNIDNDWLLDWYGLNPSGEPVSFTAGRHLITQWNEQIFFNTKPVVTGKEQLLGAMDSNGIIIILQAYTILLLDNEGSLIEQLNPAFKPFQRLGNLNSQATIETADNTIYLADQDIVSWKKITASRVDWVTPITLNENQRQKIRKSYRGNGLTLERIILDLHSGRLFNTSWGIVVMDASAIIMLLLGISGTWVWLSRKQKMKTKRHYRKHHRSSHSEM